MAIPNLDKMKASALMPFWARYQRGRGYREFFPMGGKGTLSACADLANYAANRKAALICRDRGDRKAEKVYRRICELIHDRLPDCAKFRKPKA